MILAITGHRPPRIGGYIIPNPIRNAVVEWLMDRINTLKPEILISGMALGTDQIAAEIALTCEVSVHAYIPCKGQEKAWPSSAQERWYNIIDHPLTSVTLVSEEPYFDGCMQARNRKMVEDSDHMLAVWDGAKGGTANCIGYARAVGRTIERFDPKAVPS